MPRRLAAPDTRRRLPAVRAFLEIAAAMRE